VVVVRVDAVLGERDDLQVDQVVDFVAEVEQCFDGRERLLCGVGVRSNARDAVGSAILGIYVATLCAIGAQTGLTTVLLSRYTFGRLGAKWADLLLGGTQVGWFGVTIPLVAIPTAKFFGVNTPTWVSALILLWGLFHLATAYFGYEGMEKLSLVAVRDGAVRRA